MLIDVRTKEEYDEEHIEGAVLHDVMSMVHGVFPQIPKSEKITLYCHSGSRSMVAKELMEKAGFTNVTDGGSMNDLM